MGETWRTGSSLRTKGSIRSRTRFNIATSYVLPACSVLLCRTPSSSRRDLSDTTSLPLFVRFVPSWLRRDQALKKPLAVRTFASLRHGTPLFCRCRSHLDVPVLPWDGIAAEHGLLFLVDPKLSRVRVDGEELADGLGPLELLAAGGDAHAPPGGQPLLGGLQNLT